MLVFMGKVKRLAIALLIYIFVGTIGAAQTERGTRVEFKQTVLKNGLRVGLE